MTLFSEIDWQATSAVVQALSAAAIVVLTVAPTQVLLNITHAVHRDGFAFPNPELRNRAETFAALVQAGIRLFLTQQAPEPSRVLMRLIRATKAMRNDLDMYRRGEAIPARWLPSSEHPAQLERWLSD